MSAVARTWSFVTRSPSATVTSSTSHVPVAPTADEPLAPMMVGALPKASAYAVPRSRLPVATTVSETSPIVALAVR